MVLNDKKPFYRILVIFIAGLVLGLAIGTAGSIRRNEELKSHLEQVNRDLDSAIDSQREAAERASRLQKELNGITEYARSIEAGTRKAQERTGNLEAGAESLAEQLDGVANRWGELADGIRRASGSLEENRILLNELGNIIHNLPYDSGKQNPQP